MTPPRRLFVRVAALTAAGIGCGDQAGVPHPVPVPLVERIRSTLPKNGEPLELVGLPGAVARAGRVEVTAGSARYATASTEVGSFALQVPGGPISVRIRFETSDAVEFHVSQNKANIPTTPGVPLTGTPIDPPVAGLARIRGLAQQNARVIGANFETGTVAVATADATGAFTLEIPASSGDELHIYSDGPAMSPPWRLTVP